MTQLGWNAGPRHARVWGLARSFTKQLSDATREARDQEAIAALSIFWAIVEALMPIEIVAPVNTFLEETKMPRMATRPGWEFHLNEKLYRFPYAARAPPEGYMSQAYTA
ncbi:hypothetical protein BV25DRAFT_1870914 [Artomyces pyxidatus]|uniref:Uncharacterized protein n=1 Tax=Artomyces pyxidatus TaxID=48021 RepID=A0ACB8SXK4_9AGAM|nr:hypothetical protein BV25DRAFT_1870914 [Artomyces pyxidatus]